jgi:hypothetical protein
MLLLKIHKFWSHMYDTNKISRFYSIDLIELQLEPDTGLQADNEGSEKFIVKLQP